MEKFIEEPQYTAVDHDPFTGPAIQRTIPTTEAQREVILASLMERGANCAYNESVSLELAGPLDRRAMEQAVKDLVQRHEALRAQISSDGMRMTIVEDIGINLPFSDLADLPENERAVQLELIDRQDMGTDFDLHKGPLFRARLIRTGPDTHLLRLTGHHVVCDGWSLWIMISEMGALYNAAKNGRTPALPEAGKFSEYALATLDFANSPEHKLVEQYWLDLYKKGIPYMDLPTDHARPATKTYNGKRLDLPLGNSQSRSLREVATRNGASLVTTLLTTFELLLYKLTGDGDVVVGLPASGQSDLGMKHLVGHCVNLLALRSHVDGSRSFAGHLKDRRTAMLDAFDHQKYTFGTLVRKLNIHREPGRIPLCPVVFNIDMNMDDGVAFEGMRHRFISNPRMFENFELFLNAAGSDESIILEWSFNTDLFDEATVHAWMDQFRMLVERICKNPGAAINELVGDLEVAQERRMPQPAWAGRMVAYPQKDVASLFDEVAGIYPGNIALEYGDGQLTYRQLQEKAHALSQTLVNLGVAPGEPVGLFVTRGFDMVVAMLATMRAGGCFVPFDPAYPAERLAFMLEDSRVKVLLTLSGLADTLPKHQAQVVLLDALGSPAPAKMPKLTPEAPAYMMYTSGSTGLPKGVVVPHRGIVRLVREQNFLPFGPGLSFLQLSNISFDVCTLEIWGPLLNGGRLAIPVGQVLTPSEIIANIRKHRVNAVWFTSGLFNIMVDEELDGLRGLKHILAGGDVLSVTHVGKALKALGPNVLINGYGPTENTTFTSCYPINDSAAIGSGVPIGYAVHNTTLHVLDEKRNPVPVGHKGELYTGGDGVALGYWNRPELTAERFIDDPFSGKSGAKLYRTGDIVRWQADGSLAFVGRNDGQVKVRGFRVEVGEIENALNDLGAVKDKVVVARQDGPGEKQLACYLVPAGPARKDDAVANDALINLVRDHLRTRLPGYMVPATYTVMESIPLTANGKVDRRALPAPDLRSSVMKASHVAPRNANEQMLADIWKKALNVEVIGVHDNFFDLGGHSLIGLQVLAHLEQQTGIKLPLNTLFRSPTVALFAGELEQMPGNAPTEFMAAIQRQGSKLPLFCIHGDEANYFISRDLGTDQPFYGFFHQGEDGLPIRYTSVESLASHFIKEMRTVRPKGPFLLCGFSFGGLVAYEMAQQLRDEGEQVPFLALMDTDAPSLHPTKLQNPRWYTPIKRVVMRAMVRYYRGRHTPLPPKLRHFHIIVTYEQATARYQAKPYDGPLLLIRAEESKLADSAGWKELVKGKLTVVTTPGDHFNMIKDPQVKTLSSHIGRGIEQALESTVAVAG